MRDRTKEKHETLATLWRPEVLQMWPTYLTVRFLATGTGTVTTELLGLRTAGVGNQQAAVVGDKELAELKGRGSIVVLGVVGDERLGDSLTDGVDLRSGTTTRNTEADVDGAVEQTRAKRGQRVSPPGYKCELG